MAGQTGIYTEQGGKKFFADGTGASVNIKNGATLNIDATGSFAIDGTAITATASELSTVYLTVHIADVSTASSNSLTFCPYSGTITKISSVLGGTLSVADATVTTNIGATAITGGALTLASGSVKGDIDAATPTALNVVAAGDYLEAITDGGSTGAATLDVTFEITL